MNIAQPSQSATTVRRHQAYGWIASMLLHMCGISGVLMLMAELERPALPQPFRFDVAWVRSPASQTVSESAPADMASPPTYAPPPSPVSRQPLESHRGVQAKRAVTTAQDIPRVTRDLMTTRPQVVAQPLEEKPSPHVRSIQETGQPVTQIALDSARTEARAVTTQTQATVPDPIVAPESAMPVSPTVVHPAESRETNRPVEKEPAIQQPVTIDRAAIVTQESPQPVPRASSVEHRVTTQRAVHSLPRTQADYGWLAKSLWQRIEQLKRYPWQARARRWEGKVILEAVIRDDGTIMELRIEESSGHAILDQDALAVVKQASPLTLQHALGQPQITILVPISYSLDS